MDSRVASLWPSTISTDVLQRLPRAYPARMTFGYGDSVIITASELDSRAASLRPSMIIDLLQQLARRYPAGATSFGYYGRTPAPAANRIVMRYQMGVWEYFDEYGAVTRVEYDDAYGSGRFGAVPASEAAIARLPAATAGELTEKDCAVCLESFQEGEELRKMTCPSSHAFHEKCIFKWLRVSRICPLCRFALTAEHEETQEELEETIIEGDAADACTGENGRTLQEANTGSCETSTEPAEEEADACQHRE